MRRLPRTLRAVCVCVWRVLHGSLSRTRSAPPCGACGAVRLMHVYAQTCSTSADEIREVIEAVKPCAVMIELCPSRYAAMFPNRKQSRVQARAALSEQVNVSIPLRGRDGMGGDETDTDGVPDVAQGTETVDRALRGAYGLMDRLGMKPGRDFVAAVDAANAVDAQLVLGDRDAFETMEKIAGLRDLPEVLNTQELRAGVLGLVDSLTPAADGRVWLPDVLLLPRRVREALPLLSLMMVALALSGVLAWSTEALLGVSNDAHRAVDDVLFAVPLFAMLLLLPRAYNAIIGSRDAYLMHSLLECCALLDGGSRRAAGEAKTVVAVVGLLHVNGMTKRFLQGERPGGRVHEQSGAASAHARACDGLGDSAALGDNDDDDALPRAVWVSGNRQYSRFVPPPGYEWACTSGQDFGVQRKASEPPLRDYWRRSTGRSEDGDSGGGGGSSAGIVPERVSGAQNSAVAPAGGEEPRLPWQR